MEARPDAGSLDAGHGPGRTLTGYNAVIARTTWLIVTILAIGLFVAGQSALFDKSRALDMYEADRQELVRENLAQLGVSVEFYAGYVIVLGIVLGLVCFATAAVIFVRRSNQPMALFVALLLVLLGATFTGAIGAAGERSPSLGWLADVLTGLSVVTVFMVFFLFPDGRFVPRWTRWPAVVAALYLLPAIFLPGTSLNPQRWPDLVYGLFLGGMLVVGVVAQVYRYRNISGYWQRQQTRWIVLGFAAALAGYLAIGLLPVFWTSLEPGTLAHLIAIAATIGFMLLIPLSFGVAILRFHLWDIDVVINKTLVYGALTGLLLGIYFAAVVLLQGLFRALTGQSSELAIIISTLAVAALFQPARRRIQALVDRRFYRAKYDASRILAAFGVAARDELDIERLTAAVESVLDQTVQPARVSVLVRNLSSDAQPLQPVRPDPFKPEAPAGAR